MPVDAAADVAATTPVQLEPATRAELERLAQATARDVAELIREAVDAYLDVQRWHVKSIREGLRQADAGEFATDEEVEDAYVRCR